jgi:SPP1 gp7 family putative phage head morphogenesis protein
MSNLSDDISSEITAQTLNIVRAAVGLSKPILDALKELEAELLRDLENAVGKSDFTVGRMKALLAQTRETIAGAYDGIAVANQQGLVQIAGIAAKQSLGAVNNAIGAKLTSVEWSKEQLEAIANKTVVRGNFYEEWWRQQGDDTRGRFEAQMRLGQLRGETVDQLARRVRGRRELGYKDGLMQVSRNQAQALVRTSALGVSNAARLAAYADNDDVIKGVQWVSTLDNRTTPQCIALDGKRWDFPGGDGDADYADYKPVGHDKHFEPPPIHWNCRSTVIPITYSWKELAGSHGNSKAAQMADRVPRETRASMDGQVARTKTFSDWLEGKPREFQDEVLGPARAEAWRRGELSLTGLTDQSNNPLTIAQLGIARFPKMEPALAALPAAEAAGTQARLQAAVDDAQRALAQAKQQLEAQPTPETPTAPSWLKVTEPATTPPPPPRPIAPPPSPEAQRRAPVFTKPTDAKTSLVKATPKSTKDNGGGINSSYNITYTDGTRAIWKPLEGEATDVRQTIPDRTGYIRETAASDIADMIGLSDLVPPTITTTYDTLAEAKANGIGSAQRFVEGAREAGRISGDAKFGGSPLDLARSAAWDWLIGNTDRHGGNWLVVEKGAKLQLIDNGLAFPNDMYEFRSMLFREADDLGYEIPAEARRWGEHWPEIKTYLEEHGFQDRVIELMKVRLDALNLYRTFSDLRRALNNGTLLAKFAAKKGAHAL